MKKMRFATILQPFLHVIFYLQINTDKIFLFIDVQLYFFKVMLKKTQFLKNIKKK